MNQIICWYCHNKQYSKKPCEQHDEEEIKEASQ